VGHTGVEQADRSSLIPWPIGQTLAIRTQIRFPTAVGIVEFVRFLGGCRNRPPYHRCMRRYGGEPSKQIGESLRLGNDRQQEEGPSAGLAHQGSGAVELRCVPVTWMFVPIWTAT
jgi:hypothetical protein